MTEHEHAEVSRNLALAIGWGLVYIFPVNSGKSGAQVRLGNDWVDFDYRDPLVIWPIAERFEAFPRRSVMGGAWMCRTSSLYNFSLGETAALAVARAVIASQEAK